jgi:hypothetical protein
MYPWVSLRSGCEAVAVERSWRRCDSVRPVQGLEDGRGEPILMFAKISYVRRKRKLSRCRGTVATNWPIV